MNLPRSGSLLIAGSGGFIGRALAARASRLGLHVTGLCLPRESGMDMSGMDMSGMDMPGMDVVEADITRLPELEAALSSRRFDYVVNLAGHIDHSPLFDGGRSVVEQHFGGLMNLLSVTRHDGLRGFVQVGSSDEYGNAPAPQKESMREAPISPYAVAKTAAGHLIGMLWRNQGFPGRVARLFLVYGPGQSGARFVPQLVLGALEDKRFPVSAGEQLRDFCHVEDIADGLLAMLACDAANGQCINLASGNPVSIRDLIERVVARVGGGSPQWGRIPYRTGENMALYADVSRARQLFRWQPAIGLDDGLARTIDWYRHQTDA